MDVGWMMVHDIWYTALHLEKKCAKLCILKNSRAWFWLRKDGQATSQRVYRLSCFVSCFFTSNVEHNGSHGTTLLYFPNQPSKRLLPTADQTAFLDFHEKVIQIQISLYQSARSLWEYIQPLIIEWRLRSSQTAWKNIHRIPSIPPRWQSSKLPSKI